MRSHQNVHMIWHDHERIERVTIAIEVAQRVGNRCRNLRPPKDAFAMALIEPRLTRIVEIAFDTRTSSKRSQGSG